MYDSARCARMRDGSGPPSPEPRGAIGAFRSGHRFDRRGDAGAWVCCDINVYYKKGDPKVAVAPDVAVA